MTRARRTLKKEQRVCEQASWILKGFIHAPNRERKICRRLSTPSIKRRIGRFHVVVLQWTLKKCTKKRDTRAELLFWS